MKRLYKSRRDKIIAGVCGGIAEYFDIDSTIVRIIFLLLFFMGGVGLLLYIAGMLIIPRNPEDEEKLQVENKKKASGILPVLGLLLVIIGAVLLLENLGFSLWYIFKPIFHYLLPILLIVLGLILIISHFTKRGETLMEKGEGNQFEEIKERQIKRLFRSRKNRIIFGVCGGLGEYLNTDPTIIRILWVILAISSLGIAILLYLIMAIIVPEERMT